MLFFSFFSLFFFLLFFLSFGSEHETQNNSSLPSASFQRSDTILDQMITSTSSSSNKVLPPEIALRVPIQQSSIPIPSFFQIIPTTINTSNNKKGETQNIQQQKTNEIQQLQSQKEIKLRQEQEQQKQQQLLEIQQKQQEQQKEQEKMRREKLEEDERLKREIFERKLAEAKKRAENEAQEQKEKKLVILGDKLEKKMLHKKLKRLFIIWFNENSIAKKRNEKRSLHLMFLNWKRLYSRLLKKRDLLNDSLLKIQNNLLQSDDVLNFTRNIRSIRQREEYSLLNPIYNKKLVTLHQIFDQIMKTWNIKSFKQIVSQSCAIPLFQQQTNYMRQKIGFSKLFNSNFRSDGPVWEKDLFMNISILTHSNVESPSLWDFSLGIVPNIIRGFFYDDHYHHHHHHHLSNHFPIISSWESRVTCNRGKKPLMRNCHMVITDENLRNNSNLNSEIPLSSIIILSENYCSESDFNNILQKSTLLIKENVPIVIILVKEITVQFNNENDHNNQFINWREISGDETFEIIENFLQSLANLCQKSVTIEKILLMEVFLNQGLINLIDNPFPLGNNNNDITLSNMLQIIHSI